jgi:gluconolactonase
MHWQRIGWLMVVLPTSLAAQITFHHERGKALVAAETKPERLATGMKFVEGPVWLPADHALVFSDIPARQWLRWQAGKDGSVAGVTVWQPSAAANGNTIDRDGRLLSCQHEARNVVQHDGLGKFTVLVDAHQGKRLNSPNDVVVRADGTLWFTDPTYGLGKQPREQDGNFVYRFDPASKDLRIVQREFDQPNGLCFAPDHQRLYIADSGGKQRVGAFAVTATGELGPALFWLDGGADGIRCDAVGNLWTTARDGIRGYGADGAHLVTIALPEQPANCAFGGVDGRTLFVTARTSLYAIPMQVTGAPMPPWPPAAAGKAASSVDGDKRDGDR